MSYLEKKYEKKIKDIFESLPEREDHLRSLFQKKSLKISDEVASICSHFNRKINKILKTFYPEIKDMATKLNIKSVLKFYYDLIDKLTDFVRNTEQFQKIDDRYYEAIIDFLEEKEALIQGKYRAICSQELTAFYDQTSRNNLEMILAQKFEKKSREFFTFGALEEEVKKIAKLAGAEDVIFQPPGHLANMDLIDNPKSLIVYSTRSQEEIILKKIANELKQYLESKGFQTIRFIIELEQQKDLLNVFQIGQNENILIGSVLTNADLLADNN